MTPYLTEWLHLLVRWAHFTVGIAWIGASFYFNWLNNSVRPPKNEEPGVLGEVWSVHGGAFYRVTKHDRNMPAIPKPLHWFTWEAYFTWITGVLLLGILFYFGRTIPLVAPEANLGHWTAVGIGLGSMLGFWLVYDQICKSALAKTPTLVFALMFGILSASAFGLSHIFTPRAAYIHIGAMIGTAMTANVFFIIIPGQRAMVEATREGREPDISRGIAGSTRSLHNNYFTLPILFIMLSSHFPMTYGHPMGWLVLVLLAIISVGVRHWFNLEGRGVKNRWILPVAALATITLAYTIAPSKRAAPETPVTWVEVVPIINARCTPCHAEYPTYPGYQAPPAGVVLTSRAEFANKRIQIIDQVQNKVMPLANVTGMTDAERDMVLDYLTRE